jgi:hypothetical protein
VVRCEQDAPRAGFLGDAHQAPELFVVLGARAVRRHR